MRRVRMFSLCIFAVLALGALGAGSAAAAGVLDITEGGIPLAKGATVFTGIAVQGCVQFSEGKITTNAKSKDKAAFKGIASSECVEEGASISGAIKELQVNTAGLLSLKASPKLAIRTPAECTYEYSKFAAVASLPGALLAEGVATGKLNKKVSTAGCAKTVEAGFEADLANGVFASPFNAEVKG
jgi:hypothetical protein